MERIDGLSFVDYNLLVKMVKPVVLDVLGSLVEGFKAHFVPYAGQIKQMITKLVQASASFADI